MEEWADRARGDADAARARTASACCAPATSSASRPGPRARTRCAGPGTVLILSASRAPEAIEYPDSGKIGVSPPGKIFRLDDAVDYWEGE